jgi:DnaB helicase-like protein/AAA domain-containing protein
LETRLQRGAKAAARGPGPAADPIPPLPCNLDAERCLLGAILLDNKALSIAVDQHLSVGDFFLPVHRKIFAAMQQLAAAGKRIEEIALLEVLRSDGDVEAAGGAAYVAQLADGLPRLSNVEYHARIVKEKALLRNLVDAAHAIQQQALAGEEGAEEVLARAAETISRLQGAPARSSLVGSCSTAELFAAQEENIEWLCWPFAAVGLASILDALPKVGKTVFLLQGIHASRLQRPFLGFPTKPMRVVYVSEQSRVSLAMQAREVGFTGDEPIEELRWVTREDWSRHIYSDFLVKLEKEILEPGRYNALLFDTWHTIARLEDEKDASEVNRLGNLTIDVATRNQLALSLGRHDRKSGGDIGISGRSSIQLSGLVDVILHLLRVPNQSTQRRLELLGRVPGLPNEQLIDLVEGAYVNLGKPETVTDKAAQVARWLEEEATLTGEQIVARFANQIPPVRVSLATANRLKARAAPEDLRKGKP